MLSEISAKTKISLLYSRLFSICFSIMGAFTFCQILQYSKVVSSKVERMVGVYWINSMAPKVNLQPIGCPKGN
jgi:hypothetical protein